VQVQRGDAADGKGKVTPLKIIEHFEAESGYKVGGGL